MYNLTFSDLISVAIPIGIALITIGYFKGQIKNNTTTITAHEDQIKKLASKDELAVVAKRAEEDRGKGQAQWREFHNKTSEHAERLSSLETRQTTIVNSLEEIRADFREMGKDIKEILRRLPQSQ